MREDARKEKDQALLKSLEEMKVGFDRIASALGGFMEASKRLEKEAQDKRDRSLNEGVKRQEDFEGRWMREVERRHMFEKNQEKERIGLSLKLGHMDAGVQVRRRD